MGIFTREQIIEKQQQDSERVEKIFLEKEQKIQKKMEEHRKFLNSIVKS